MLFYFRNKNKTIKELRKKQGYTAQELAIKTKLNTSVILKIDNRKLKHVPEPLKSKILPSLKGIDLGKYPW